MDVQMDEGHFCFRFTVSSSQSSVLDSTADARSLKTVN
jgi:hypothetical protein